MNKLVALVEFPRSSFGQKYSFFTKLKDLKEDDILLVQTRTGYSIAKFKGYTNEDAYIGVANAWIVKSLQSDIDEFEEKLFLGELD